jgi:WD40 repeat protein
MSDPSHPGHESLPPSVLQRRDEVCYRFEAAWKAAEFTGERPRIEDYLDDTPKSESSLLLPALIALEVDYRRRAGEQPQEKEYRARFPTLDFARLSCTLAPNPPAPTLSEAVPATIAPAGPKTPLTGMPEVTIAGYEIVGELGRGGMGVVYKARQIGLQRLVALKMILAGAHAGPQELARFRREAEAVAHFQHPHIVQIHEIGEQDGRPYFSLEFVEGGSLANKLAGTPLAARQAAQLVERLTDAMHAAHQRGIIHRDLKPANVLLTADGIPKVTDFGLAKRLDAGIGLTESGVIVGTPSYMAPEQAACKSKEIGPACDVYALGAILYETLTGRPPFRAETPLDTVLQVLHNEPVAPRQLNDKVPKDLETICLKAMAKAPIGRYATARALGDDLRRFLRGEPITARPIRRLERWWRWCRRNPGLAGALGAAAAFLLLGTVVSSLLAVHALTQARRADSEARMAQENERLAKENEQTAKENENRAREAKLESDRWHYASEMKLASLEAEAGRMGLVQQRLREHEPRGPGDHDLRGFEWYYLERLCQLDLRTIKGPKRGVEAVAFSPDGRRLASVSQDGTVKVWDVATGQEFLSLKGHDSVAFSPDGRRLASVGQDETVKIWDAATGQEFRTLKGHRTWVMSLAFSPGGGRLASASSDQTVKLWDVATGQESLTLKGHTGTVTSVVFSPDGRRVASAGRDGTVRVWGATTEREFFTLKGHTGEAASVAFSPDGRRLASAGQDQTVKVWDATTGQESFTLKGHTGAVTSVAFSPDGRRVASASADQTVKLWDVATRHQSLTLNGHTGAVTSVAFSPDGRCLASASADQTVKLWDAAIGQQALTFKGYARWMNGLAFSPDSRWLAFVGKGQTVQIWDAATGQHTRSLTGHSDEVTCVAFSPDGGRLVSGSADRTMKLWDLATGQELLTLKGHATRLNGVVFSPDGRRLASACADGTVKVWDAATGHESRAFNGSVGDLTSVAFNPDGRYLACGCVARIVKVWDATSGQESLSLQGHTGFVYGVAYSPDGRRLASASADQTVKLWDADTGQESFTLKGHTDAVRSVAFSPDGRRLATGSQDQTVKVWDAFTGQEILTIKGHTSAVHAVAFSPDGRCLASASVDGTVKIWDARPLTQQRLIEREARGLLQFLFAKGLSPEEAAAAIRRDPTITEAVRQQALAWVEPLWRSLTR